MNDEVQNLRSRLQDLHDAHTTGFVDDAAYAEACALFERQITEAKQRAAARLAATAGSAPAGDVADTSATRPTPAKPPAPRGGSDRSTARAPKAGGAPKRVWWWVALYVLALLGVVAYGGWQHLNSRARPLPPRPGVSAPTVSLEAASSGAPLPAAVVSSAPLADAAETFEAVPPAPRPSAVSSVDEPPPALRPTPGATATSISGEVRLDPALVSRTSPHDTVFVYARAVGGPAVPLAVLRKQVRDLPLSFSFDDSMAMWPEARVSAFPRVVITARVSKSGEGVVRRGDLIGQSSEVAVGAAGLMLDIRTVVDGG